MFTPSETPALTRFAPDAQPVRSDHTPVESILVVDDEESFRHVVVRQLRKAGFRTFEARDGAEAIRQFTEHAADISAVLLDLVMPHTSGGETLTMLRYYSPSLPIVVTSGYTELAALSLKDTERGVGFLRKPFAAVDLIAELRRVMSERLPTQRNLAPPTSLF
jgi:two-component system, cell cycle sensor histidine kinase and response regulator CckA